MELSAAAAVRGCHRESLPCDTAALLGYNPFGVARDPDSGLDGTISMAPSNRSAATGRRFRDHRGLISRAAIDRLAQQVAEGFRPDRIILFGSYAYGRPDADSDVDLLVVMPTRNEIDE